MNIKISIFLFSLVLVILIAGFRGENNSNISIQTQECIECHRGITPGIVADWENSLHSTTSVSISRIKPEPERRISSTDIPEDITNFVVGCYECHGLEKGNHKDNFEHFGHSINLVVSPNDCATCHETEVREYQHSKKGYALDILRKNPIYSKFVNTYTSLQTLNDKNELKSTMLSHSKNESCYACHGTEVGVTGLKKIETDLGEIEVPALTNWPNMGVGRINPDGSFGACTSCHPRHNFSIEIARKPSTCGQCHLEPDVPAYNVYKESKHGTIAENFENKFDFDAVPWVAGRDFTSPTCATCHSSLITDTEGNIIAKRTHDFGERLWVRIFGLPFAHNQPITPKTYEILNSDNLTLPTSFANIPAKDFLISDDEISERKNKMGKICKSCHGSSWVTSHFTNLDSTIISTNKMTQTATDMVSLAWKNKLADPGNPFDEPIEQQWISTWLIYSNSIRYAAAMSGPDYAGFKNGWYELSNTLQQMQSSLNQKKKRK
jgi:hypothetical protein